MIFCFLNNGAFKWVNVKDKIKLKKKLTKKLKRKSIIT